jgi:NHLM bacteriocin system ABC transporter ATP-binding protein
MSGVRQKARPVGAALKLDPRRPLRLDGVADAFLVRRGHVDVFARLAKGARRSLFRVEPGGVLIGLPGDAGVEVLAVGAAELMPTPLSQIEPRLADAWARRLAEVVGPADDPLPAIRAWLQAAAAEETAQLAARLDRDLARRQSLFGGLVALVTPGQAEAAGETAADDDPLFAACSAVARTLGLEPLTRLPAAGPPQEFGSLREIARASGVRVRQTVLRADWWREDVGPQVAWLDEARIPVAILPAGKDYVIFDPQTGARTPLDAGLAARLSADAACFYRPLPAGPLGLRALTAWIGIVAHGDLRRILLAAGGAALTALVAPALTGVLVDQAILRSDPGVLLFCALALAAAAFGAAGFLAMQSIAVLRLGASADALLQGAVMDRVLRLPARFFKGYSAGDLADRVFGVESLRRVFSGRAIGGVLAGVFSLFSFVLMAVLDARLALVAIGLALVQLGVITAFAFRKLRHERAYAEAHGLARGLVLQMLTGVGKLRVAAATTRVLALWAGRFSGQVGRFVDARRATGALTTFNAAFPVLATLAVFALAQPGPDAGFGRFLAFFAAFGQALATLSLFGAALGEFLAAAPALERLWPIITAEPEPRPQGGEDHVLTGAIEMRDVHFAYSAAQRPVLEKLSFSVAPGEFVALVGPSGGGKSTIFRLLLGFERAGAGAILYDGRPVEALDMVKLRRQVGVVLQDGRLLSGSLYENICGTMILPEEQVWAAVRRAGLEADIRSVPMGLHTVVTEGSAALSGGQRQRLLIARALVHEPRLLLFDEATSALDNNTQAIVSSALAELSVTRIVIAHRLSTIRDADRILVIDQGRVVQEGTFDTLNRQPGLFADLARRQLA